MKRLILALFLLPTCILACIIAAVSSQWGTHQLLTQGLQLAGNPVTIGEIKGTLAGSLSLSQLRYEQNGAVVHIGNIHLHWLPEKLLEGEFRIQSLLVQQIDATIPANNEETDTDSTPFAGLNIPIAVRCDSCRIEKIKISQGNSINEIEFIQLQAGLNRDKLSLDQLAIASPQPELTAELTGSAQLEPTIPFELNLTWRGQLPDTGPIAGNTHIEGSLEQIRLTSETTQPFQTRINGEVRALQEPAPVFDLNGEWHAIRWPIILSAEDKPLVSSPEGTLQIAGTTDKFNLKVETQLRQADIPPAALTLNATASPVELFDSQSTITTDQGTLIAEASANWQDLKDIQLKIDSRAKNFNPAIINPEIPGTLNFETRVEGHLQENLFFGQVDLKSLSGILRNYPLSGQGKIDVQGESLAIQQLNLTSGPNKVSANGQLTTSNSNLKFKVQAPNLAAAWPGLNGTFQTEGTITGNLRNPIIAATLDASNIRYEEIELASAEGTLQLSQSTPSEIHLKVAGLKQAQQEIRAITLNADGTIEAHQFVISLQSDQGNLSTQITGSWEQTAALWQGQVENTVLNAPMTGTWKQTNRANVDVSVPTGQTPAFAMKDFCLRGTEGALCATGTQDQTGLTKADIEIDSIPLAMAPITLPENIDLKGALSGQVHVHGPIDQLQGKAEIALDSASQITLTQEDLTKTITLGGTNIIATSNKDEINTTLALAKNDFISLEGQITLGQTGDKKLLGQIDTRIADLSLISTLAPEITPVKGQLEMHTNISGTLMHPKVLLQGNLDGAEIGVQPVGITLKGIKFSVTPSPDKDQLLLNAEVSSDEGTIKADGTLELSGEQPGPLLLAVKGENFKAVKLPEAEISISPDLNINATTEKVLITGKLTVPHANVEIQEVPESTVTVSSDEVIVTSESNKADDAEDTGGPEIHADVTVVLGSDIHFAGKGLSTGMTGSVRVRQDANTTKVNGVLATKDGSFEAFGQKLAISKGEFQFNGPADNPWIHVVASRLSRDESITAYVTVEGNLLSAQTTVSASDSSLSEQEALSYLVTGKSVSNLQSSDRSSLATAAMALGAEHTAWLAEKIGIDEFSVKEGDTFEDSLIALGAHLTPGFYVGAEIGPFNHEQTVVIKQSITDNVSIQGESGTSQSIELNYGVDYECLWPTDCDGDETTKE